MFFNNIAVAYIASCTVFTGLDQLPVDILVSTVVMCLLEAFAIMIFVENILNWFLSGARTVPESDTRVFSFHVTHECMFLDS